MTEASGHIVDLTGRLQELETSLTESRSRENKLLKDLEENKRRYREAKHGITHLKGITLWLHCNLRCAVFCLLDFFMPEAESWNFDLKKVKASGMYFQPVDQLIKWLIISLSVSYCMACRGAAAAAVTGQHSEGGDHPSQTGAPAASQRSGLVRCVKLRHIKSKCSNVFVYFSSSGFGFVFVFISYNFYGYSLWINIFNVSVMAKTKSNISI